MFVGGAAIIALCAFGIFFFILPQEPVYAPAFPVEDLESPPQESLANIVIATPVAGDEIGFPLVLSGQARVFENVFQYRIRDDAGIVLAAGHASAAAPDVGQFGSFSLEVSYSEPTVSSGFVEVFSLSAHDGSEQDMITIPVTFASDVLVQDVSVYFVSRSALAQGTSCTDVVAVSRRVPQTVAIAHAALTSLLSGVYAYEDADLLSSLPSYAQLRSVSIEDGVATVLFAKDSFLGVAGSCTVASVRSQIEATLGQFSSINKVILLEEGKTPEETLQP